MHHRTDVSYTYDGSFDGLLCCVFESYARKEIPAAIHGPGETQLSLFGMREIETNETKANRVCNAIPGKICLDALDFVQRAFLTCHPERERLILLFLRKGFVHGPKIMHMLGDDVVDALSKAVRHLGSEAHLLSGFVRFSIHDGVLVAKISPKNYVLPLLAPHFAGRYPSERFIIYDDTHDMVLAHKDGQMTICAAETFEMPQADAQEMLYRQLWKMFYDTIAVEGRENPRCRMTHMPKRYWHNMTEFATYGGESLRRQRGGRDKK